MTLGTARDVQNEGTARATRAMHMWCTKVAPHRIGVDRRTPQHPWIDEGEVDLAGQTAG